MLLHPIRSHRRSPRAAASLALGVLCATALGCDDGLPLGNEGTGGRLGTGGNGGDSPWAHKDAAPFGDGSGAGNADAFDDTNVDAAQFNCPEVPTAYVLEYADPFSMTLGTASLLLSTAGFKVEPLPLDRDPRDLRGLIFIGSFASENNPVYMEYVARNATPLYTFVDAANVLVQMTQADQTEPRPLFLPNSQAARRTDVDVGALVSLDIQHPLLAGVPLDAAGKLVWQTPRLGWETFGAQSGFAVLLAANR
ncbi:MAG: hypothetical protein H7X95_11430, partial [Deltaproteobacteria bacterium]|nr:hypothetical protein [Deltaproteobacteria bacterium]